jgi:hypothetical protein
VFHVSGKYNAMRRKKGYGKEYLPSLIFKEEEYSGAGMQIQGKMH